MELSLEKVNWKSLRNAGLLIASLWVFLDRRVKLALLASAGLVLDSSLFELALEPTLRRCFFVWYFDGSFAEMASLRACPTFSLAISSPTYNHILISMSRGLRRKNIVNPTNSVLSCLVTLVTYLLPSPCF